jgi:putative polyhydroxyalkanoate system protein
LADIELRRAHDLGLAGARKVADKLAADLGRKFDLRGGWNGNTLRFERPGVAGTLAVTERDLHLSVSLGFLLKAMKGSIERAVVAELDELVPARAKAAGARPAPAVKSKKAPARPKKGP